MPTKHPEIMALLAAADDTARAIAEARNTEPDDDPTAAGATLPPAAVRFLEAQALKATPPVDPAEEAYNILYPNG